MMNKMKVSEIKARVAALLKELPSGSPRAWLMKQIQAARNDRKRDIETLEMLCAALEKGASKQRNRKIPRKPAKR